MKKVKKCVSMMMCLVLMYVISFQAVISINAESLLTNEQMEQLKAGEVVEAEGEVFSDANHH